MRMVNVQEAKTHFSRLIAAAHAGETILVAKDGKPWARLVPLENDRRHKRPVALLMAQSLLLDTPSGWELATKVRLGKLPGAEGLLQDLPSHVHQQGFQPLAVQLHHGVHAGGYR